MMEDPCDTFVDMGDTGDTDNKLAATREGSPDSVLT